MVNEKNESTEKVKPEGNTDPTVPNSPDVKQEELERGRDRRTGSPQRWLRSETRDSAGTADAGGRRQNNRLSDDSLRRSSDYKRCLNQFMKPSAANKGFAPWWTAFMI